MVPKMLEVGACGPLDGRSSSLWSLGGLGEELVFPRMTDVGTCAHWDGRNRSLWFLGWQG